MPSADRWYRGNPGDPGDPRAGCESAGSMEKTLKKSQENERMHASKMASW